MSKHPLIDLAGHLMWTRDGIVWATWRIKPLAYNKALDDKYAVMKLHRMLVRAIQGEALMYSTLVQEDPVSVIDRMIADLDLEQVPAWITECEATLDTLSAIPLGQRHHWLSVPLSNTGSQRLTTPARAAMRNLRETLDLPLDRPRPEDLAARALQAAQIEDLIPAPFEATRVSVAEQIWYQTHCQRRGQLDIPLPDPGSTSEELLELAGIHLPRPILDEGARSDETTASRANLLAQRVLKISDAAALDTLDMAPSYQALMAVSEAPVGGLIFPGSEVLDGLDKTGLDVDWAIRLRINSRDKVLARNRKAVRSLNEQYVQRERETSTGLHDLRLAAELLTEYDELFASDKFEVEVEHTIVLAVAAAATGEDSTPEQVNALAQDQANALAKLMYSTSGIKLERLPGHQEDLWWAMQPGTPRSSIVQAYRQYTSSGHFAKLVPYVCSRLGGSSGPVLMLDMSSSRPRPVHIDPSGYPELDMSGSMLWVAELGAGKTVGQKTVCSHVVDQGGQFWAVDKSDDGEWARFAATFDSHAIVDPWEPTWSMDPLRIMPVETGSDIARNALVQLLDLNTQDRTGLDLARVLSPDFLTSRGLDGLGDLTRHLLETDEPGLSAGKDLGERLALWADNPLARVWFDQGLPPVPLEVDATAWLTRGLGQPTADELANPNLFRQLPVEKIFGRAYYRLLTGLARRLCFADRSRPTVFNIDELYDFTQNPANVVDLQHFVRQGRRPKALVCGGTHDVGDTNDEVLSGLIPTRILMRHRDGGLAARGLRWLGLDEADPEFAMRLKQVREDMSPVLGEAGVPAGRRGECLVRDAFGNIGFAKVLPPSNPRRRVAVLSTPPKASVRR